jgi:hypothetical protein
MKQVDPGELWRPHAERERRTRREQPSRWCFTTASRRGVTAHRGGGGGEERIGCGSVRGRVGIGGREILLAAPCLPSSVSSCGRASATRSPGPAPQPRQQEKIVSSNHAARRPHTATDDDARPLRGPPPSPSARFLSWALVGWAVDPGNSDSPLDLHAFFRFRNLHL